MRSGLAPTPPAACDDLDDDEYDYDDDDGDVGDYDSADDEGGGDWGSEVEDLK